MKALSVRTTENVRQCEKEIISNTLSSDASQTRGDDNALISPRVTVVPIPFALQSASNSDSYKVNSTSSNVMPSFQFSSQ